ncbi:MAG: serine acetyltransferase [Pseudomonadota bacterium]
MSENETSGAKGPDLIREMGLWQVIREDIRTHQYAYTRPGLWAVMIYRWGTWAETLKPKPLKWLMLFFYEFGQRFVRNFCGIELKRTAKIGRRFFVAHQSAIVIHELARIGDDVTVRQNVTFGIGAEWDPNNWPTIGNRVEFSPGAVVIGNITIGDDVSVGPNCVVTKDVPAGRTLFVSPPRVFPKNMASEKPVATADTTRKEQTPSDE